MIKFPKWRNRSAPLSEASSKESSRRWNEDRQETERMPKLGVIGSSGLYSMDGLSNVQHIKMDTPFGDPSDELLLGEIGGREIVFLARHGRGHRKMPSEVNSRANIYALKQLG